ncbi:hypothetical protein HYH03_005737 [Edaphochlamys debaryana]|uniref:Helicase C-terminal domain-containing protein n=1 Tax=Edaphochlamys debaryana TaxID=47281 RepID=A0A836C227_9CHLO|nr:hypothetical protein HYH03_005737 [Edaphochlamys debaryana]|eukprot:KAG2496134.1 hypothetical protein HYH03_005737 [Edaphochlamys debaryana]
MATEGPVGLRHYYAAVGNKEAKLATLMELLQTLQSSGRRSLAICCSSRDTLDALVYALLQSGGFAVTALHSDLTEKEREMALTAFKRGAAGPPRAPATAPSPAPGPGPSPAAAGPEEPGQGQEGAGREGPAAGGCEAGTRSRAGEAAGGGGRGAAAEESLLPCVLVLTDVCTKVLPKELLPLGISLLVEYDLPPSKDLYTRRLSLFGGGKDRRSQRCVVVDLAEAGALAAFRALEGFAAAPVQELPVRVEEMFA